jgi:hypothetical protein
MNQISPERDLGLSSDLGCMYKIYKWLTGRMLTPDEISMSGRPVRPEVLVSFTRLTMVEVDLITINVQWK